MANIKKYIKALLYPAGDNQESHKAHQAGNQSARREWDPYSNMNNHTKKTST